MESPFTDTTSGNPNFARYPVTGDMDQMSDTPKRGSHRRAQSETFFRLPDDILFDVNADFALQDIDIPSLTLSDGNDSAGNGFFPVPMESGKSEESNGIMEKEKVMGHNHFRSLSVDAAFFDDLGFQGVENEKPRVQEKRMHRHSNSMDGSSSSFEGDLNDFTKKAMAADKLAELALIDPKRAKRILANRQSAARSKERKIRYTGELERKVQMLQTEATTLSAQLTLLQRDTTGLTGENKELKMRLQAMEQQAHLRDALNDALREEVQHLRVATGQVQTVNGNSFNPLLQPSASPFYSQSQQLHHIGGGHHNQQLHMSHTSPTGQALGCPSPRGSMDFIGGSNNHR
ncbi:transcription factor VIP1-like [Tasmannia lanceolata]|uniref:transcription factor VIP1-like n=1 Tax=Tasmannia lanceolata TaxID=3420 RepID=UPI0040645470